MTHYLLTHEWALGLLMSALVALVIGVIVGISILSERLTGRATKSETAPVTSEEETRAPSLVSLIMSRLATRDLPTETPLGNVAGNTSEAGQRAAMPGNGGNDVLPGNALPEEIREIMRFQAKVEAVERVIKSGKMGQAEAVETIFECKRSGRPESVYARAVKALRDRSDAAYRANQDKLAAVVAANQKEI
jgi:hypothetical protein